ncbi:hypothetical protein DMC25_14520 [Caulobacter sp. D4A]|uniref:DUF2141 domain-containing protein n=1 Tax=unclassified Caulobacter TaxID=2648921 RepID=UPI000D7307BB|nr:MULTISPECIES: DUF2141 domain-containing protein [unclassified Caulobacter]PXA84147.1 hypothetical protein DMC18_24055 [Caulobacter sp. D5]PXA86013.1 hypothetical protein DMC25_14520 [Caulobacter sp. D4A]
MRLLPLLACAALLTAPAAGLCQTAVPDAGLATSATAAPVPGDASLAVAFPDLKSHEGVLMVALFDSQAAWAGGKPVQVTFVPAAASEPVAKLQGLAAGTYAVRVFQDLDGDQRLSMNPFGLPVEPYGFSGGAKANMGPPAFAAAAFTVTPGDNAQAITLR